MAGAPDPFRWKRYWGQFSGDYDNRREIETYDNMMAEYAGIYGIPVVYYTLHVDDYKNDLDVIHGESSTPVWDRSIQLTALTDQLSQEPQNFTQFGLENIDTLILYIHRSTFDGLVGWRSGETPVQAPNLTPRPSRRGGYGPVAKDIIGTLHNGLFYEVVTGGLHFLESNSQHFGHKFWYKLTLKSREASAPVIGLGEQYGPVAQGMTLEQLATSKGLPADYYQGNTQFVVPTPDCDDMTQPFPDPELVGTQPTSTDSPDSCGRIAYQTTGGPAGPVDLTQVPEDYYLPDGRIAEKYRVQGPKSFSAKGDNEEVQAAADQVVDPQSNLNVYKDLPSGRQGTFNEQSIPVYVDDGTVIPPDSEDYRSFIGYNKYGPSGRVIRHNRELWSDW
jgi:hypothetical protein